MQLTKYEERILNDILESREKKYQLIQNLTHKSGETILKMEFNIPGKQKNFDILDTILSRVSKELKKFLSKKIDYLFITELKQEFYSGNVLIWITNNIDAITLKKNVLLFEEQHELGKVIDFDIYNKNGISIRRTELGFEPKKCFLCDNPAIFCIKNKTHSQDELIKFFWNKIEVYNDKGN